MDLRSHVSLFHEKTATLNSNVAVLMFKGLRLEATTTCCDHKPEAYATFSLPELLEPLPIVRLERGKVSS